MGFHTVPPTDQSKAPALATHIIVDLSLCDEELISWAGPVEAAMLEAAEQARATIVHHFFHQFEPRGVSGIVVIAESHIAVHTWPEHGYAAADILSCGSMDYERAIETLAARFGAGDTKIRIEKRRSAAAPGTTDIAETK